MDSVKINKLPCTLVFTGFSHWKTLAADQKVEWEKGQDIYSPAPSLLGYGFATGVSSTNEDHSFSWGALFQLQLLLLGTSYCSFPLLIQA